MKKHILLALGTVLGFSLTACDEGAPGEKEIDPAPTPEEAVGADNLESGEKKTVRGLLRHFPQNVKSSEAWLGHEFMVGETPIRTSEKVSAEELMKLVGENVEIEGVWNAGEKWEPPEPTEEGFNLQHPSYPEGMTVIRGSVLEAASVRKVEK